MVINIKVEDIYKQDILPRLIKIRVHNERIWVKPTNVKYELEVANNMVDRYKSVGDIIKVRPNKHVLDIWK